jgi:hypothetical protein
VSKPASVCLVEDTANRYKVNRGSAMQAKNTPLSKFIEEK